MGDGQGATGLRQPWQSSQALLLLPVALIAVITVVEVHSPQDFHLASALVIAPALTASFAGPRTTAAVGAMTVVAQSLIGLLHGELATANRIVQLITLTVLSVLVVIYCAIRDRRHAQLVRVRSVAEAAQHVLMWPLPEQMGFVRIASLYLAAEDEAQIGGDLYAATRAFGGIRVLIGDVRGKGLSAIGEAATLLGAFREAAHRRPVLTDLAEALEQSVQRYAADFEPPEEAGERFATALLVEIPEEYPVVRMATCGHPPPLLLCQGRRITVPTLHPSPPLGVQGCGLGPGGCGPAARELDEIPFAPGDTLLLYTDGVIEARDADGRFYPLAERVSRWCDAPPDALVQHVRRDLVAHTGGRLDDDAAVVVLHRTSAARGRQHMRVIETGGFRPSTGPGPATR
ncbi:PP2C family protein-serine/threonine phosphatase [Streptomyces sp. NPDC102462]|uniref:PP2C family protein-serine/threonine phosphatase n=1 Tax=Streptomyces sp. NPDC102462 TaxID=3366178 RepID=UPI003829AE18